MRFFDELRTTDGFPTPIKKSLGIPQSSKSAKNPVRYYCGRKRGKGSIDRVLRRLERRIERSYVRPAFLARWHFRSMSRNCISIFRCRFRIALCDVLGPYDSGGRDQTTIRATTSERARARDFVRTQFVCRHLLYCFE